MDSQEMSGWLAAARWDRTVLCQAIKAALLELGVPHPDTPAPIVNAVSILERALHGVPALIDGSGAGGSMEP